MQHMSEIFGYVFDNSYEECVEQIVGLTEKWVAAV